MDKSDLRAGIYDTTMSERDSKVHLRDLTTYVQVSPGAGASMAEAASVCFEDQGHHSGVSMRVQGSYTSIFVVEWDGTTDEMRSTWADEQVTTEQGAYGCAILVVERLAGLRVVERSRKRTGFDWWLGHADDKLFQKKARLEISGIRRGKDKINARVNQKKQQTTRSDATKLEALVVVVEFGEPVSHVEKRA